MSCWKPYMTKMLRVLLWDVGLEPKYSDGRLQDLLIVSAQLVNQDISFFNTYNIDVNKVTITPDPTTTPNPQAVNSNTERDDQFINFTCLRAACLADQSSLRTAAFQEGVRIVCGPTQMSVNGKIKGFDTLISKGPCATYEEMKMDWLFGNGFSIQAILSPFVSNKFDPSLLSYNYDYNTDYYGGNRI